MDKCQFCNNRAEYWISDTKMVCIKHYKKYKKWMEDNNEPKK